MGGSYPGEKATIPAGVSIPLLLLRLAANNSGLLVPKPPEKRNGPVAVYLKRKLIFVLVR